MWPLLSTDICFPTTSILIEDKFLGLKGWSFVCVWKREIKAFKVRLGNNVMIMMPWILFFITYFIITLRNLFLVSGWLDRVKRDSQAQTSFCVSDRHCTGKQTNPWATAGEARTGSSLGGASVSPAADHAQVSPAHCEPPACQPYGCCPCQPHSTISGKNIVCTYAHIFLFFHCLIYS